MKTIKQLSKYLLSLMALGLYLASPTASANDCKPDKFKLKVNEHGLWLKPDGQPKCLPVDDLGNVNATFEIRLKSPGPYELRSGQVHVRNAVAKEIDGVAINCGQELELEDEYTNVDEDPILITVVGTNVPADDVVCFEIVVDDIGMLDPRARVVDEDALRGILDDRIRELVEAYDLLAESDLGVALLTDTLDSFLIENFDITEAKARLRLNALQTE